MDEKRRDRIEIIQLEKRLAGAELENLRLDRVSQTLHLTTDHRDKSSNLNTHRNGTEYSEVVLRDQNWGGIIQGRVLKTDSKGLIIGR